MRRVVIGIACLLFAATAYGQRRTPLSRALADALYLRLSGAAAMTGQLKLFPQTFATLGTPEDGTIAYCSDCTSANPTAGGGGGSFVKRENGAWNGGASAAGVAGPVTSTVDAIAVWGDVTGDTLKDTPVLISAAGELFLPNTVTLVGDASGNLRIVGPLAGLILDTISNLSATRTVAFQDANGTIALTANKLSAFAATTSAEFAGVISNETGIGLVPLATNPTFTGVTINTAISDGSGLQHIRVGGCTTGGLALDICTTDVTWPVAFADTNYTASVTCDTPSGNSSLILTTSAKTTTQITVSTLSVEAGAASCTTLNLIGMHD